MSDFAPIISLRNVSRSFQSGTGETVKVLEDLSLDIEPGSFNVIRGESGSGKTTLLRILGMLDSGFDGEFSIGGISLADRPVWFLDEMRSNNLGFIFQEGRLFEHMSLERNIEVPMQLQGVRQAEELDERIKALEPTFYKEREIAEQILKSDPKQASGGQKQRASVMRAIINRPSIILADEPTASLHSDLKQEVVDHLRELCEAGHTVIIVSHDAVFYDYGRQLELEKGVLREIVNETVQADSALEVRKPPDGQDILWGWMPRAPMSILARQAYRETIGRPLFLLLVLVSLIVGVSQVSVFSSVIIGAQEYIDVQMTEGSRLNRVRIKPRARDRGADDRFPVQDEISDWQIVKGVVERRETSAILRKIDGSKKTTTSMGLHADDPEYNLLQFVAGGAFDPSNSKPEIILTAGVLSEVFDASHFKDEEIDFDAFIGKDVDLVVNRYNTSGKLAGEVPVAMRVAGIILNGESGRQIYMPNRTQLLFDMIRRDRKGAFQLPENAGFENWLDEVTIEKMTDFPWQDSLHVYSTEIDKIVPLITELAGQGYQPESDVWKFKWALDVQDTAWKIFIPLLGLIILAAIITVSTNIFTSAKLRETELALWRVLGMRRGDMVMTQVLATTFSVALGTIIGLFAGNLMISQSKAMLQQRAEETAKASGNAVQNFDVIFAPVSDFFWMVLVIAVVIGILAALYPAYRTANTDPARVLQG